MKYLSVCSGIEAATVAWHPLGWHPWAFSEIEKFPSKVLAHHYPNVPNLGDMTKWMDWPDAGIDILVGGTPCQSFSVAGLRTGMADPRGNLALVYLAIADRYRPRWLCWENVPGVLSSNGGRDFGAILGALAKLGYGFSYRVLDAQYFGVPQRRRRVFVVGYLGDWRPAAEVLFEPHCLQGHSPPSREAGEGVAVHPTLRAGGNSTGGDRPPGTDVDTCEGLIARCDTTGEGMRHDPSLETFVTAFQSKASPSNSMNPAQVLPAMDKGKSDGLCVAIQERADADGNSGPQGKGWQADKAYTLEARHRPQSVAFSCKDSGGDCGSLSPTLRAMGHSGSSPNGGGQVAVASPSAVRRITPLEAERLQGFPDRYTAIPGAADGPRYKALGNSFAVPVMAWIGQRIERCERLMERFAA